MAKLIKYHSLKELAIASGFDDEKDFHRLVASVDLSTPAKIKAFENWKKSDGTKRGLLLLDAENQNDRAYPNPLDYTILHLGVSGGKDSTAALLWLVYMSGWPLSRLRVAFCDTGNEDLLTYAYLKMLSELVFPIETICPERDFWQLTRWKKRFPSRRARFCTQFLKVIPTRNRIFDLMKQGEILLLTGVRADEAHASNNRGELPQFGWEYVACDVFRPILNWSLEDVWAIHKKFLPLEGVLSLLSKDPELSQEHKEELIAKMIDRRIPRNPLYGMGAKRVGCFP